LKKQIKRPSKTAEQQNMELSRNTAKFTPHEMIEELQEENKYLREILVEEKVKSKDSIRALNKALTEVKEDNSELSRQIEDYMELKEHYSNLKKQGII
jgi:predicted  nucleic acid-binding Zn-ribbon protein